MVSERLGHSNPSFMLTVYGQVVPGMHEGASQGSRRRCYRRPDRAVQVEPSGITACSITLCALIHWRSASRGTRSTRPIWMTGI